MSVASSRTVLTIASVAGVVALLAMSAASARADDGEAPADLLARSESDAAAGRSYLGPTAVTNPAGSATATVRFPLFPAIEGSMTLSPHDRLEVFVGGGAALAIFDESNYPYRVIAGGAKLALVRAPRAAFALTASAYRRPGYRECDPFDPICWEHNRLVVAEVGAVGSACVGESCMAVVSAHAHYIKDIWGGEDTTVFGGASAVVGRGVSRLVVDATYIGNTEGEGTFGYVGYRASKRGVALDAGALLFVGDSSREILPWPTFGLSTRL